MVVKETKPVKNAPKRFYFPQYAPQLNRELQQSLALTVQRATLESKDLPPLPQQPYKIFALNLPEQKFLSLDAKEQAFYAPETDQATQLLQQFQYDIAFNGNVSDAALASLQNGLFFVQNDFLRNLLENALAAKDFDQFALELSDYYTLDKSFEDAAFSYTVRHPHKRTLQLRRFMLNPFINEELKKPITNFLAAREIQPAQYEAFKTALTNLHQAYSQLQTQALSAPGIQAQQEYYANLIDRVEAFVTQNGRLPKWNTRSQQEREFCNEIGNALSNDTLSIPVLEASQNGLKMILAKYATKHRSRQETLAAFEAFVKTTGLMYPRPVTESNTVLKEEELLYDDLMYWRTLSEASVGDQIRMIRFRYSEPSDEFYR